MRLAVLFLLLPLTAEARVLRSEDLRPLLEAGNGRVGARKLEVQGADSRTGHLTRSFLPLVEGTFAQERFRRGESEWKTQPAFGIGASLNLFNGGRDHLEERLRDTRRDKLGAEARVTIYEELLETRESYWKALFLRDLVALYRELAAENQASLRAAERRIRGGVSTATDRFEFEMKAVEIRQELAAAEAELGVLKEDLKARLGLEEDETVELTETLAHDHDWSKLLEHSEKEHDFLSEPSRFAASELSLGASLKGRYWWPKLDAYAAWQQPNQLEENLPFASQRREAVIGLRLSVVFWDGGRALAEASALRAEAGAALLAAEHRHRMVEVEIHREASELRYLHTLVHEAGENIERAQRYQKLTLSEYNRGVKNSPDVLGAMEKLFEVRRKRLEILRDFQIAKAHVLSVIGR